MAAAIKAVGPGSSILASDLGAAPLDKPADGFVAFVRRLQELGVTEAELDQMTVATRRPCSASEHSAEMGLEVAGQGSSLRGVIPSSAGRRPRRDPFQP